MSDRAISEAIRKMTDQHKDDRVTYVNATVNSVDIGKRICNCTVIDGHTEYEFPNVKLMAVVDDGILLEPVLNSTVKVIFSMNIEPYIAQYSEIENITLDAKTKIQLNDGSFGGLIKIGDLVKKLNTLEKDLNNVKKVFASWTPLAETVLKTSLVPWYGQQITETKVSDIENPLIQHGI